MTTLAALLRRACRSPSAPGPARSCGDPLGIAVVGGLIVSQALTLYTTPVVYLLLEGMRLRFLKWWRRPPGRAVITDPAAA